MWTFGCKVHFGTPSTQTLKGGAELIVNISASPYHAEKGNSRKRMLATRAADNIVIVAFNNLVGGQDELIFDGGSMVFDQKGDLLCQGKQFEEDFIVTDLNLDAVFLQRIHDPRRRKEKFAPSGHEDNLKKIDLKMAKTQKKPALRRVGYHTGFKFLLFIFLVQVGLISVHELIHTTCGIHQFHLTGIKGMRGAGNFQFDQWIFNPIFQLYSLFRSSC